MHARRILAIANRGEIAVRIARTALKLGWEPVALLGRPDMGSYAAREIGNVVQLPEGGEFDPAAVVSAAVNAGATALHPGYGFLSERPALARACREAGITFIGPTPETLELCGDKVRSREVAADSSVPVIQGSDILDLDRPEDWNAIARDTGYPVIVKVAGAGGGRGLRVANGPDDLSGAVQAAAREAGSSGAEQSLFLEHYLTGARHVEVQVAGDGSRAVALGDRDCSLQRRHQKVIEEAPAPGLNPELRAAIHESAVRMAEAVELHNLATVEFLVGSNDDFYFMEINPRLQVEHTVTEEVTNLDLVAIQLDLAGGGTLPEPVAPRGHAIQARLYAEDPFQDFMPDAGELLHLRFPSTAGDNSRLRVDQGYESNDTVPGAYDPMLAKVIVWAEDRDVAIQGSVGALEQIEVAGLATNRPWLIALLKDERFAANQHDLGTAGQLDLEWAPPGDNIIAALADSLIEAGGESDSWSDAGPFRLVAPATFTIHGDDRQGWQKTVTVRRESEHPHRTTIIPLAGDQYEISTASGRWIARLGPLVGSRESSRSSDGVLVAPMPGTVLAIHVEDGARVTAGESVATVEAMKMEISLDAPFDGTVTTVHTAAGKLIGAKQPVVTIAPDDAED